MGDPRIGLNRDPFDPRRAHLVAATTVELRRAASQAAAIVFRRLFERPAVLEIGRDPGCPENVVAELGRDAGRGCCAPADHRVGFRLRLEVYLTAYLDGPLGSSRSPAPSR